MDESCSNPRGTRNGTRDCHFNQWALTLAGPATNSFSCSSAPMQIRFPEPREALVSANMGHMGKFSEEYDTW